MRRHQRLLEHRIQRGGDIVRGVGCEEEARRRALCQRTGDRGDDGVDVIVFVIAKAGRILDRLVRDIEHRDRDAAVLHRSARIFVRSAELYHTQSS